MGCKEIRELLSPYIDGVLEEKTCNSIEEHLQLCSECREELAALKETMSLLSALPEVEPPSDFKAGLRERLAKENTIDITHKSKKKRKWLPLAGVALVASLMLVIGLSSAYNSLMPQILDMGAAESTDMMAMDTPQPASEKPAYERVELDPAPEMGAAVVSREEERALIERELEEEAKASMDKSVEASEAGLDDQAQTYERKIIKNAYLNLEVDKYQNVTNRVEELVFSHGGYIQDSSHAVNDRGIASGNMTIRVPQESFEVVIGEIEQLGILKNINRSGDDVTRDFYDTEARLNVLKEQERRLVELLDRADALEEILDVERELGRIRSQIEVLEGRIRYLSHLTDLATINLRIQEAVTATDQIVAPKISEVMSRTGQAFIVNTNNLLISIGELVVWFGAWLPLIIVAGFIVTVIVIVFKKSYKKK